MEMMALEDGGGEGDISFSGSSSSTTTTRTTSPPSGELRSRAWDGFSPLVDWGAFDDDHFHGLIESMMVSDGGGDGNYQDHRRCYAWDPPQDLIPPLNATPSNSSVSSGNSSGVAMAMGEGREEPDSSDEEEEVDEEEGAGEQDMKGLRLVHLLMAAAEALTGENRSLELARVILVRLKELASFTASSNMVRLAAYFTNALQELVDGSSGAKHSHREEQHQHQQKQLQMVLQQHHPSDVMAAFQLLQDMSPYVKFGHFTANQAILEAVTGERRVHIIDYDIMEGVQWASLMQAFVSRNDSPPPTHLRITAISRGSSHGRRPVGMIQDTGRRLMAFAASIGQPFSFGQCRLDADENFRPAGIKLVKGEALVVNCMLHLPHSAATQRPPGSVASILSGAAALGPRLITLVEEEVAGRSGAEGGGGFVGRFMDSLHHYSAVYDSLEAGFPSDGRARALVERVFLGPRIAATVDRVYQLASGGGDVPRVVGSWSDWMAEAGFGIVGISFFNHCQAKLLLGLFNDGYRVEEAAANKLVLAWKSRRLISASVWSAPAAAPPTNSPYQPQPSLPATCA